MAPPSTPNLSFRRPLRVGFLPLTDAAPLIVAEELGLYTRHGVQVELRREIGWATIREKIVYGELDAAQAPAPMLWAAKLGLGSSACDVLTAHVLSLHGNAITLSRALWDAGVRDAPSLRRHVTERRARTPLTLGIVFPFSSQQLLLRDWLRSGGIDPARDVRIVVVPPAQTVRHLVAGTIDGYCVGEPWNSLAVSEGAGWCPTWSAAQAPGHLEKVLLVTRRFAETFHEEHAALVAALREAAAWCDEPGNCDALATMLSVPRYLNVAPSVAASALTGNFDCGYGRVESVPDFHRFRRGPADLPLATAAAALQAALIAAGLLPPGTDPALPQHLFREELPHQPTHKHARQLIPVSAPLNASL